VLVVVYNPDPLRPYREVVSWAHRISGVCLIAFPALAVLRSVGDVRIHFNNVKQAWVWVFADVKWLLLMGFAAISSRVKLPEQGKFNAAQKLNFMMVMSTYPIYIVTGLTMWISGTALLAWLIHFGLAVLATPFIFGHMFMATIPASSRKGLQGMFSGLVDRHWAKHHHARWYRENFEHADNGAAATNSAAQPERVVFLPQGSATGNARQLGLSRLKAVSRGLEAVSTHAAPGNGNRLAERASSIGMDGNDSRNENRVSGTSEGNGGDGGRGGKGDNGMHGRRDPVDTARLLRSDTLRAIVLGLQNGQRHDWIVQGRAAAEAAARECDWELAAGLFRELWPDVRGMDLNREEMRAIIRRLMERKDLGMAAKASALRIMQDPTDSVAINCMLKVADASLRARAWDGAIKIYEFLERNCPDSPYGGYFSRGIELAEQWSRNGDGATPFVTASLEAIDSEADPEARV
jgi:formate dehydrogenase gamma subunit